jgi:hypothetical protein
MTKTTAALDQEWARTYGCSRSGREALRRWALAHPAIAGFRDLDDVLEGRRDPDAAQAILLALARLAPDDEIAARTLLQALLPGLVRMALTGFRDDPDAFEDMTALAWERIRTYPQQRLGSVAANVIIDVRKRYLANRRDDRAIPTGDIQVLARAGTPSAEDEALKVLSAAEMVTAARELGLSEEALRLVVRTRVEDRPLRELAREDGVERSRLQCIRWRAEQKLRRGMKDVA